MSAGGAAQRRLRHVERQTGRRREAIEHAREVPAGPRAQVHDRAAAVERVLEQVGERGRERLEVAGGEEALARGDHVGAVSGRSGAAARHQAEVALARDVERMPARAGDRPGAPLQRAAAGGAAEHREDLVERVAGSRHLRVALRSMGRRSRRRASEGARAPASTTDYSDAEGNVLTLRDELSAGTLRALGELDAKPASSAEDRWQRRVELLFERLAVRWTIAGLPIDSQKELLGRYRLASSAERQQVRAAIAEHLAKHHPEIEL